MAVAILLLFIFIFLMGYDSWMVGFLFQLGLDLVLVLVMVEHVNLEILVWVLRWQIASV